MSIQTYSDTVSSPSSRRSGDERRRQPAHALCSYGLVGRRRHQRRNFDRFKLPSDWFESPIFAVVFAIIVLCVVDFAITLFIINHGGIELNLFMEQVIAVGVPAFFTAKYMLTTLSLILLVAHRKHRLFKAVKVSAVLYVFLLGYLTLIGYELMLLGVI